MCVCVISLFPCQAYILFPSRVKHINEVTGKSTATHAKILSPDCVNIYQFPVSIQVCVCVRTCMRACIYVCAHMCVILFLAIKFLYCSFPTAVKRAHDLHSLIDYSFEMIN